MTVVTMRVTGMPLGVTNRHLPHIITSLIRTNSAMYRVRLVGMSAVSTGMGSRASIVRMTVASTGKMIASALVTGSAEPSALIGSSDITRLWWSQGAG